MDYILETISDDHHPPLFYRLSTSDAENYTAVFHQKDYGSIDFSHEPTTIFDLGAYVGFSAVYLSRRFPRATIICVEPNPESYEILKKNIAPYPNIHAIHAGIWTKSGFLEIVGQNYGEWGTFVRYSATPTDIRALTLADVSRFSESVGGKSVPDFMKIDIEGSEKVVFSEPNDIIPQTGIISVELHDRFVSGCTKAVVDALSDFREGKRSGENRVFYREN